MFKAAFFAGFVSVCAHERHYFKKRELGKLWIQSSTVYDFYAHNDISCVPYIPYKYQNQKMWQEYTKDCLYERLTELPYRFGARDTWNEYAKKSCGNIMKVPLQYQTFGMWTEYIRIYPSEADKVPKQFQSSKMWKEYVAANPAYINHVPKEEQTQDMWDRYMRSGWRSLGDVPLKFRSKEMCIEYTKGGRSVRYVPPEHFTHKMLVQSVNNDNREIDLVPDSFRTQEFYCDIFNYNIRSIKIIPKEFITWNMCERIPIESGFVKYIPEIYIEKYLDKFTSSVFKPHNLQYFYGMETSGKILKKYFKQMQIRQLTQYDYNDNTSWHFIDFFAGGKIIENDNLIALNLDFMSRMYKCNTNKCFVNDIIPLDDAKVTFCKDGVKITRFIRGPKTEYPSNI